MANAACWLWVKKFLKVRRPQYSKIFIALPGWWGNEVWLTRKDDKQLYHFITKGTQNSNRPESRQIFIKLKEAYLK